MPLQLFFIREANPVENRLNGARARLSGGMNC